MLEHASNLYFAYGSNMSTRRLQHRLPGAVPLGIAEWRERALVFDKLSRDGSGKANLISRAGECSWGVVFRLQTHHWAVLDSFEPGYSRCDSMVLQPDGSELDVQTYLADADHVAGEAAPPPYDWYLEHLLLGAREHGLPLAYIARLEAIETQSEAGSRPRCAEEVDS